MHIIWDSQPDLDGDWIGVELNIIVVCSKVGATVVLLMLNVHIVEPVIGSDKGKQ